MLGSLHTSDIRRFVPRLIFQERRVSTGRANLPLFKLDWDSVDEYKKEEYRKWITNVFPRDIIGEISPYHTDTVKVESWKDQSPDANEIYIKNWSPGTLPPETDIKIKDLSFALSNDYIRGIEHFTRLFVEERVRNWGFDTVVRDRCMSPSDAAINTAFYLLSDCMYHEESGGWYRGPYKRLHFHSMRYKFWRLYTGRGLVWNKAGLPDLENTVSVMEQMKIGTKESNQDRKYYTEYMRQLESWSVKQEKFWAFATVNEKCDDLRPEYGESFSGGVRGKYANRSVMDEGAAKDLALKDLEASNVDTTGL